MKVIPGGNISFCNEFATDAWMAMYLVFLYMSPYLMTKGGCEHIIVLTACTLISLN